MHEPERLEEDLPSALPAHNGVPAEVQRMGLSRHTEEGALVEFAASLDSAKTTHRTIAWLMLFAFFAPAVLVLLAAIF